MGGKITTIKNKSTLNPMEFHLRFQHITEQIFEKLDKESLKNCREVSKSWQNFIDNRNILWIKLIKKEEGNKAFQLACIKGRVFTVFFNQNCKRPNFLLVLQNHKSKILKK